MKQDQKSVFLHLASSRGGQAVVEYILLCVVVLAIVMAAKKMFKTLDDGINNYIGGYIACLMEYGELPSLGVKNNELKKHMAGTGKKCEAKFEEFTFSDGRPPTGGGGGGSGGGGGGSGSGRGNSNANSGRGGSGSGDGGDANNKGNGSDSDGDGNEAVSAIGKGGGSGGSGSKRREIRSDGGYSAYSTADNPYNDTSKTRLLEDEEDESGRNRDRAGRRRLGGTYGRAEPYRAISGRMKQELEKQQKRKPAVRTPTKTVKKLTDDAKTRVTIKKNIERGPAGKDIQQKSNTDGFTFGNILRWLLIAAMVIAIVIFFGGQIMNYSNSSD